MQMHRRMHRDVSSDHDLSDQAVVGNMDGSPRGCWGVLVGAGLHLKKG